MNLEEFDKKWSKYIEDRFDGLEFENEDVIKYLDSEFEKEILVNPNFKFSQIKIKFGMARVYAKSDKTNEWEDEIDRIIKSSK